MRIAFITRSTIHEVPGGDTVQIMQTAKNLREQGWEIDVCRTNEDIDYAKYQLLHFSNITRPSDILYHIKKSETPFVLSPILVDYSEYDKLHRQGFSGFILRQFSKDSNEYIKTMFRWLSGKDVLKSKSFIWKGQRGSIKEILKKSKILLPNSENEDKMLKELYGVTKPYVVVPNGIDATLFTPDNKMLKDNKLVLCAARIEGIKNQLNLIKALNNTSYTLVIIGSPAPNQKNYYAQCRKIASKNVIFHGRVPQETLVQHYKEAKVHALPSWYETCGLSSLEAAAMGCNVAISEKGFTRDYFGDDAFYAEPGSIESIFRSIEQAAQSDCRENLQQKILKNYTWKQAALKTAEAYRQIINH